MAFAPGLSAGADTPARPPTVLDLAPGANRPVIAGEPAPDPQARLGAAAKAAADQIKAAELAAEKLAAAQAAAAQAAAAQAAAATQAQKQAETARLSKEAAAERQRIAAAERRMKARDAAAAGGLLVLLDGGRVTVPRALMDAMVATEVYPDLVGVGLDLTLLRSATARHHYGGRIGLGIPTVPDANWYSPDGDPAPRFTEVDAVLIDLAFEYAYRRHLFGPVGVMFRTGIGVGIIAGDVLRTETLPVCPGGDLATCPHWRKVGQQPAPLPSRVWPSLHAALGLTADLGGGFGLQVDAGLRDALYVGGGLSFGL